MPREISTTGSKKVSTLMKEFNAHFPHLRIRFCPFSEKEKVKKGELIYGVDITTSLAAVRTKKGVGEISLTGSKLIGNLERDFENIFGLYIQICWTEKTGERYYTSTTDDKKSLAALNREKEAAGCKKDEWK